MPTIIVIRGVKIKVYYNDHNPPHVHGEYNGQEIVVGLNGNILKGDLPTKQRKIMLQYVEENKKYLKEEWERFND